MKTFYLQAINNQSDSKFPPNLVALTLIVTVLFCSACATTPSSLYTEVDVPKEKMDAYLQDKPEPLHPYYTKVLKQGEHNVVLNQMEAGLAAMEIGDYDNAERSFDEALLNIEMVYKENDENAEKALSLWHEEGMKDFKGEPYERAMAFYYRGLLFLRKGDFENARASFLGGLIQDSIAVDEKFQQDFGLLTFMAGWASQLDGDTVKAQEFYEETKKYNPSFVSPSFEDNILIIAETGMAPKKVQDGKNHELLRFERGISLEQSVRIKFLDGSHAAQKMEDVFKQASTRGEREIDVINKGKAEFKNTADTVGDVALAAGAMTAYTSSMSGNNSGSIAGLAVMSVGLASKMFAAATKTDADTRQWSNLPDSVHIFTHQAPVDDITFGLEFNDANGTVIREVAFSPKVENIKGKYGMSWIRPNQAVLH